MNLMYNLLLAIVLSAVAQILSFGKVMWPAILGDILMAYIMEMVIALCLPFSKWGMALANQYAQPGTLKYRILMTTGTAIPFSIAMCLGMSFIGTVLSEALYAYLMFVSAETIDRYNDRFRDLNEGKLNLEGFLAADAADERS